MPSPALPTCPTCGRPFRFDETPTPPFCSERCQMIDLGRWLDEEIGLPCEPEDDVEGETWARDEPPGGRHDFDD